MSSMSYQCRNARRDLLRRDQLDAVNRGRLDVHLRLCEHCSDIANEFSLIDSNFQRIPQPSQEKLQAIYCGLEPAVREIVNSKEEGLSSQCLDTQRALLRRDSLNAFRRSRMNIHLRRCESCESIADEFSVIEAGDFRETPQLSRERLQAVYGRLVPVVHEITNEEEKSRWLWLKHVLQPQPAFFFKAGLAAATAVVAITLFRMIPSNPADNTAQPDTEASEILMSSAVNPANVARTGLVQRHEGIVHIDGQDAVKNERFAVRKGTRIAVDKGGRFSFRIGDIARVALFEETEWQLTAATRTFVAIRLESGRLAIDFDGQSGKVLEITTPESLVRVKGTVFTVEALSGGETRVGVLEGLVEVVPRKGEPRTIEVGEGQLVSVPGNMGLELITEAQQSLAAELQLLDDYPEELTRVVRFDGSPEMVKVEVNGRVLGITPLTVRLPTGPFTYKLTSPGMEPIVGNIVSRENRESVDFSMLPADDYEPIVIRSNIKELRKRIARKAKASSKGSSKQTWGLFKRARAAMTAGDIHYAIGLLERATRDVSGNKLITGLAMLAECYTATGKYSDAADMFDKIAEKVPNSVAGQNARYEVGRLSADQLGDLSRARGAFTAYLASPLGGSLKEDAYYSLCEIDGRRGVHKNALHCFNAFLLAFPTGPHTPDARLWRGALYQDTERRWADAERDLITFIRARPRHPRADEARYRMAIGRYQMGDRRGALRIIGEYLRQHPNGRYRLRVERLRRAALDPDYSPMLDAK